ncbi:GntR family transcriptional regulator [Kitasatospora sp. NPDC001175]|uniref:GntR family transcriptional regulator n=1 Tax=Kitasatospora sp. NPDC001175 TaxID=3157103 RepID=UPI003D08345E
MSTPPQQPKGREAITEDLRRRIAEGDVGDEGRLAGSEQELADHYGVNRLTMRAALTQLRTDRLIETRRGRDGGIFAVKWRPIPRVSPQRLSAEQRTSGRSIWDIELDGRPYEVRDIQIEQLPAPERVARSLELEPGALVWRRYRRFFVEGVPVQFAESFLPAGLVEGSRITQIDSGPGGTPARLKELGHEPVRHREELRSRAATATEREKLALPMDAGVLDIVRVAWDASGLPVERTEMILDASRYLLAYEF